MPKVEGVHQNRTKTLFQEKSASTTSNAVQLFTFSNIEQGKKYKITVHNNCYYSDGNQGNDMRVDVTSDVGLSTFSVGFDGISGASFGNDPQGIQPFDTQQTRVFTATSDGTITFTSRIVVPGSIAVTATLEELPNHEETSQW